MAPRCSPATRWRRREPADAEVLQARRLGHRRYVPVGRQEGPVGEAHLDLAGVRPSSCRIEGVGRFRSSCDVEDGVAVTVPRCPGGMIEERSSGADSTFPGTNDEPRNHSQVLVGRRTQRLPRLIHDNRKTRRM